MRLLIFGLIIITQCAFAQNPYPQDYFRSPLDIPLVLAGTFAELRSNHFHSGLDIKTQQTEGLKVYAAADGYVSRIKVSFYGYGKALYITHPNGYVTVYAHLKKFSEPIETLIKQEQYKNQSFEIELFPEAGKLEVSKDEVVAFSGNTGGSAGPHLHFEIRDKSETPINPMLFGIGSADSTRPKLVSVFAYPLEEDSHVNSTNESIELRLRPQSVGNYIAESIEAYGAIGFGIETYDRLDLASNKNGVYNIQTFFNGNRSIEIDFKKFTFNETRHLNRLIDYEYYSTKRKRIQKLFIQPNNPLSLYTYKHENGIIRIQDSLSGVYKVRVRDYDNNEIWLTIPIKGKKRADYKRKIIKATDHFLYANQPTTLEKGNVTVTIPKNTFYDDFFIDFNVSNDTLKLHQPTIPAQKNFSINFDISHYQEKDRRQLYLASVSKYGKLYYSRTINKGNILTTKTKYLGTYTIATDATPPTIEPINVQENKWISNYRYLKLKIDDEESGINSYRATINGKWILMEYDYKKNSLIYDFNDNIIADTKNNLRVIVTDNVGNSSTFETTFYRK